MPDSLTEKVSACPAVFTRNSPSLEQTFEMNLRKIGVNFRHRLRTKTPSELSSRLPIQTHQNYSTVNPFQHHTFMFSETAIAAPMADIQDEPNFTIRDPPPREARPYMYHLNLLQTVRLELVQTLPQACTDGTVLGLSHCNHVRHAFGWGGGASSSNC